MTDKLAKQLGELDTGSRAAVNLISRTMNNISIYIHLPENAISIFGAKLVTGNNRGIIQAIGRPDPRKEQSKRTGGFDVTLRKNSDSTKHPKSEEIYRIPYKYIGQDDVRIINDEGTEKVQVPTGHGSFVLLWPCTTANDFTCTTIENIRILADWILVKAGNGAKFEKVAYDEVDKLRKNLIGGKRKTRKGKRKYKKRKTQKGGKKGRKKRKTQRRKRKRHTRRRRGGGGKRFFMGSWVDDGDDGDDPTATLRHQAEAASRDTTPAFLRAMQAERREREAREVAEYRKKKRERPDWTATPFGTPHGALDVSHLLTRSLPLEVQEEKPPEAASGSAAIEEDDSDSDYMDTSKVEVV